MEPPGKSKLDMCDKCFNKVYAYSILGSKPYINAKIGCSKCHMINDFKSKDDLEYYKVAVFSNKGITY